MAGRKPFEPTPEQRGFVESLTGYGMKQAEIARLVINPTTQKPIDAKTLREHFRAELDVGQTKVFAKVAESIVIQAIGAPAVYDKDKNLIRKEQPRVPSAAFFFAKCQMRWKETEHVELTGKDGGPVEVAQYDDAKRARALGAFIAKKRALEKKA